MTILSAGKVCVWVALGMALSVGVGWGDPTNRFVALDSPAPAFPYDSWNTAAHDIKSAVDVANAYNEGDTVLVSNGLYNLSAEIIVSNTWVMSVTNDPALTVVDGQGSNRCFSLKHSNACVAGLTVTHGYSTSGAGVSISSGVLSNCWITACTNSSGTFYLGGGGVFGNGNGTIVNCVIAGNRCAYSGGGILLYLANSRIENCLVSNNISAYGGGIYLDSTGTGGTTNVIRYTTVATNTASNNGGGVLMNEAKTVIEHCLITDNVAGGLGGGVAKYMGTIEDCIIARNSAGGGGGGIGATAAVGHTALRCLIVSNVATAGGGGGVRIMNGTAGECIVANCLIAWNRAPDTGPGGGIFMDATTASVLRNCTVASNSVGVGGWGGGLRVTGGHVEDSIVYYNIRTNTGAVDNHSVYSATYVCTFTNSCTTPAITPAANLYLANNITSDPSFVNKSQGNFRLAKGSLCINAGVNRAWMDGARDLDGVSRIDRFSGVVDIGAYEYILRGTMLTTR